jgi:hypothetical protein
MTATIPRQAGDLGTEEARAIGAEAYAFLFSMVAMEATRQQETNAEAGQSE